MLTTPAKRTAATPPDDSRRPSKKLAVDVTSSPEEGELDDAVPSPPPSASLTVPSVRQDDGTVPGRGKREFSNIPGIVMAFPFKKKSSGVENGSGIGSAGGEEARGKGKEKGKDRGPAIYERSEEDDRKIRQQDAHTEARRLKRRQPHGGRSDRPMDRADHWEPSHDSTRRTRDSYIPSGGAYPGRDRARDDRPERGRSVSPEPGSITEDQETGEPKAKERDNDDLPRKRDRDHSSPSTVSPSSRSPVSPPSTSHSASHSQKPRSKSKSRRRSSKEKPHRLPPPRSPTRESRGRDYYSSRDDDRTYPPRDRDDDRFYPPRDGDRSYVPERSYYPGYDYGRDPRDHYRRPSPEAFDSYYTNRDYPPRSDFPIIRDHRDERDRGDWRTRPEPRPARRYADDHYSPPPARGYVDSYRPSARPQYDFAKTPPREGTIYRPVSPQIPPQVQSSYRLVSPGLGGPRESVLGPLTPPRPPISTPPAPPPEPPLQPSGPPPPPPPLELGRKRKDDTLPDGHAAVSISLPSLLSKKPGAPREDRSPPSMGLLRTRPPSPKLEEGEGEEDGLVKLRDDARRRRDDRPKVESKGEKGKEPGETEGEVEQGQVILKKKREPIHRTRDEEKEAYGRVFVGCGKQSDYDVLTKLGEGTFGEVHKAIHTPTGASVALKRILMHNEKEGMPVTALREIKILKALNHPCVVEIMDMFLVRSKGKDCPLSVYMVFPYMDHDLAGLLENERVKLSPSQIKLYMKQLLEGTEYMHRNHILHRDMKAANLLISNTGSLRIADFGLARTYDPNIVRGGDFRLDKNGRERKYTNCVVTRWYRPPELLLGARQYGGEVDIWGIGCVLGEMFSRKPILPGNSDLDQLEKIWLLCGTPNQQSWPNYDQLPGCEGVRRFPNVFTRKIKTSYEAIGAETVDLLDKLLTCNPKERISASEALDHDYFWTDPLPADPKSLPVYEASHEFDKRGRRHQPPPGPHGPVDGPPRPSLPPVLQHHQHQQQQQHPNQLPPLYFNGRGQPQTGRDNFRHGPPSHFPPPPGYPSHLPPPPHGYQGGPPSHPYPHQPPFPSMPSHPHHRGMPYGAHQGGPFPPPPPGKPPPPLPPSNPPMRYDPNGMHPIPMNMDGRPPGLPPRPSMPFPRGGGGGGGRGGGFQHPNPSQGHRHSQRPGGPGPPNGEAGGAVGGGGLNYG
ncbi:hypothetical protein JAAARDRAFT_152682 [Jaapia argillacea MUCL 33604]|uniref:Protein kinase domain-containing protein n=1 Tax=Jaapia argillacea MUCL 33604 TaxID=933084 RepID=A0A067Q9F2_9AGAM|nr:hypothetical protein JAAARDRAFT_152682 [Jaapia argillacea MUCL 33604]